MHRPHPLFDPEWYSQRYPEVASSGLHPLAHYLTLGDAANFWPHPIFDPRYYGLQFPEIPHRDGARLAHFFEVGGLAGASPHRFFQCAWYLARHPELAESGQNPLWHYLCEGEVRGYAPHPLFDPVHYLVANPDLKDLPCLLAHYIHHGMHEGRAPNPLFAPDWYAACYPDAISGGLDLLSHYDTLGDAAGYLPHPLFDPAHYGAQYPKLPQTGGARLAHYIEEGAAEGASSHPLFDAARYCEQHPELAQAGLNPLVHYLERGDAEGATPHPLFDPAHYGAQFPELSSTAGVRLLHYIQEGAAKGASPHPLFDAAWYVEQFPEVAESGENPLVHYLERGDAQDATPHPLFDSVHYGESQPEIAGAGGARLVHYLLQGGLGEENPHPLFDSQWYAENSRLRVPDHEPRLLHYLAMGDEKDAWPHPLFNPHYYCDQHPELVRRGGARLVHYVAEGGRAGSSPHTLFDGGWYGLQVPELAETGEIPLCHYLRVGEELNFWPHPLFDPSHYRSMNPDAGESDALLVHYVSYGVHERRAPNALFDPGWYAARYPDAEASEVDLLMHYCNVGDALDYWPNPLFDPVHYGSKWPDLPQAGALRLRHYMESTREDAADPHPLFDSARYVRSYMNDAEGRETPLAHYLRIGETSGCRPHPLFDPVYYRDQNTDLPHSPGRLFAHYLHHGVQEGRKPNPIFDAAWYRRQVPACEDSGLEPLGHYASQGAAEGRVPHPLFDPAWYRETCMEEGSSPEEPFAHFLLEGAEAGLDPHPLFNSSWYGEFHRLDEDEVSIFHYLEKGVPQGLQPAVFFDVAYYESRSGVRRSSGQGPFEHFVEAGWQEGHRPSPRFDFCLQFFRERDPLLRACSGNPFAGFFTTRFAPLSNPEFERTIHFESADRPDVSIVIPAFGSLPYTLACLRSLSAAETRATFEVILVDDGVEAPGLEILSRIENLVLLKNARNLGFLRSCNRGARDARGKKIVFLNNDTLVTDDWLDELLASFEEFPGAGIVGSRLLQANGQVQEAGSLVWADGVATNRGFGRDPGESRFSYARPVDYVSAASLMIEGSLFDELEGFDEAFLPAFYEDTDLAFRVREAGAEVLCQPASSVIHFGGRSYGMHPGRGHKVHQEENREFFAERWREVLRDRPQWEPGAVLDRTSGTRGSVLVMDATMLTPDQDSGSLRMQNLLRTLRRMNFDVTFLPADLGSPEGYVEKLQRLGIRVIVSPEYTSVERFLETDGSTFDACILSRPNVGDRWIKTVRTLCSRAVVLYDTVDLHFLRRERELGVRGTSQVTQVEADQELRSCRRADGVIVVSDFDRRYLMRTDPGIETHIVSNIHEVHPSRRPFELRSGLLFIGGFNHSPNTDGVLWFVSEILPRIQQSVPDVVVRIVGSKMPPEVHALASDRVVVEGFVEDVGPLFTETRVSIAPLRYGSGVKGKVNQSMSFGVPCVATSIAAEGVEAKDGVEILIADTPEKFAQSVVDLYTSEKLWNGIAKRSVESLERNFSMEVAEANLRQLLRRYKILDD